VNEDKATRYNRLKRQAGIASVAWGVVFLLVLVVSGGSIALRDAAAATASGVFPAAWGRPATVVVYVLLITLLNEAGSLPLSFYGGFILERRYGFARQPIRAWLVDQLKSLALGLLLGSAAAVILYALIARFPIGWWLPAAAVFTLLIVGLANLAPLLLLPLFYSVKPLNRETLRARLVALGERAGARVIDAYEWGLGEKTSKANAALTGIGGSRRILVSDTMLAEYSDDEIEVVLAHELAHHVHGDLWKGLAFETVLILAGFFAASWLLRFAAPLGLGFDELGKRRHGTEPTLFFCDELLEVYGSEDASTAEGASYAVEHWAAAGFWKELIAGLEAFRARECDGLPLAFWTWHDKVEDQHAAHTSDELAEAFGEPWFDEDRFLSAAAVMLDGVKAFWDGLWEDHVKGRTSL